MERNRIPKPGEIYRHFKDRLYQIITVATHAENGEQMVVYQALYGDFKTYVRPLGMFLSEVDRNKYPEVKQINRFELYTFPHDIQDENNQKHEIVEDKEIPVTDNSKEFLETNVCNKDLVQNIPETVNEILLKFLEASSYSKKLEVITSNKNHMTDRLINDMAVSIDCTVDEGPIDERIKELIFCLQAMCRFEDRRGR